MQLVHKNMITILPVLRLFCYSKPQTATVLGESGEIDFDKHFCKITTISTKLTCRDLNKNAVPNNQ